MLRLSLFGAPRLELAGSPTPIRRTKALALLAYLALSGRPQERETLIALLWPEFDAASARNNLRRELSLLRANLGDQTIEVSGTQLAWRPGPDAWVDVLAFREQLAARQAHTHAAGELCAECAARLERGVELYHEELLAGFSVQESAAFDEWLFFQREELRAELVVALEELVAWHSGRGAYERALAFARRRLALDPLHEPAQRSLIGLYGRAGQQAAALRQYDECVRLLQQELGVEPDAETRALYALVKGRRETLPEAAAVPLSGATRMTPPAPGVSSASASAAPTLQPIAAHQQPAAQLPPLAPGFVGRQRELAEVVRRLTDPDCRLLTITGPGGVGKTHLALRVAHTIAEGWAGAEALADGVRFVSLATVEAAAGPLPALAAALSLDFYPGASPLQQLLDHLGPRRMLIVLDNFEQLLDGADLLGALLGAAPGLRLLVTSRVALNLPQEWFHPLEGLSFPRCDDLGSEVAQLARYDAVRLFEQCARRVRADFSLSRSRVSVVRLCRLVEGMPLALELAASWLKALSVEQIVAAVEGDLGALTSRDRTMPARHRSMRTVLEESWRLLAPAEQQTFAMLSVFAGSFSAEAAAAVCAPAGAAEAGAPAAQPPQAATLHLLANLVDTSLLRTLADGRFQLHELLRQFAAERLRAQPGAAQQAAVRHTRFFLALAEGASAELHGPDQLIWVQRLAADEENLRAALTWTRAAGDDATYQRLCGALWQYWNVRGSRSEGRGWIEAALDKCGRAGEETELCAQLLRGAGTLALNQDDYEAAEAAFAQSLRVCERLGDEDGVGLAVNNLGLVAWAQGRLGAARDAFERSLALAPEQGSEWTRDAVMHNLAAIRAQLGDIAGARPLFAQSLAMSRARRDTLGILISLVDYAYALACHGDYQAAEALADEGLALSREAGNAQLTSDSLGVLGMVALLRGEASRARALLEQALALSHAVDEGRTAPPEPLVYLGMALLWEGELAAALERLRAALAAAERSGSGVKLVLALRGLACAAAEAGGHRRAAVLFGAAEVRARRQGQLLLPAECALTLPHLRAVREALGAKGFAGAWNEGAGLDALAACALALEPHEQPRPAGLRAA